MNNCLSLFRISSRAASTLPDADAGTSVSWTCISITRLIIRCGSAENPYKLVQFLFPIITTAFESAQQCTVSKFFYAFSLFVLLSELINQCDESDFEPDLVCSKVIDECHILRRQERAHLMECLEQNIVGPLTANIVHSFTAKESE